MSTSRRSFFAALAGVALLPKIARAAPAGAMRTVVSGETATLSAGVISSASIVESFGAAVLSTVSVDGRVTVATGSGFGAHSDLMEWFGPTVPIDKMTADNSAWCVKHDGRIHYGAAYDALRPAAEFEDEAPHRIADREPVSVCDSPAGPSDPPAPAQRGTPFNRRPVHTAKLPHRSETVSVIPRENIT